MILTVGNIADMIAKQTRDAMRVYDAVILSQQGLQLSKVHCKGFYLNGLSTK